MVALSRSIEIELLLKNLATAPLRAAGNDITKFSRTAEAETRKADLGMKVLSKTTHVLIGAISGLAVGALFSLFDGFSKTTEQTKEFTDALESLANQLSTLPLEDTAAKLKKLTESTGTTFFGILPRSFGNDAALAEEDLGRLVRAIESVRKATEEARTNAAGPSGTAFKQLSELYPEAAFQDDTGRLRKTADVVRGILEGAQRGGRKERLLAEQLIGPDAPKLIDDIQKIGAGIKEIAAVEDSFPKNFTFLSEDVAKQKANLDASKKDWQDWADTILKEDKRVTEEQAKQLAIQRAKEKSAFDEREAEFKAIRDINLNIAEQIEQINIENIQDPVEKINAAYDLQIKKLRELLTRGETVDKAGVDQLAKGLDQKRINEVAEALKKANAAAFDLGKQFAETFASGLGSAIADALLGIKSLEEGLKDLERQLISAFVQLGVKIAVFGAFGIPLFEKGGVVKKYASGGTVTGPTLGILGEAGDEAVIPLEGGNVPVKFTGGGAPGGGTGAVHISFNVSTIDSKSFTDPLVQNKRAVIEIVQAAVRGHYNLRGRIREAVT